VDGGRGLIREPPGPVSSVEEHALDDFEDRGNSERDPERAVEPAQRANLTPGEAQRNEPGRSAVISALLMSKPRRTRWPRQRSAKSPGRRRDYRSRDQNANAITRAVARTAGRNRLRDAGNWCSVRKWRLTPVVVRAVQCDDTAGGDDV